MSLTEAIHVAFAADENYVQHLGVAMKSLLHNTNPDVPVHITVIGDNLSTESILKLKQIAVGNNVLITFPEADFDAFGDLKVNFHFSRAMYGRFLIPDIIDADKVLYLDCDILIRSDLSSLWKIDIAEYYSGAVVDPFLTGLDEYYISPGPRIIPLGQSYFNSGVMVLNLKKIREDKLIEKALRVLYEKSDMISFPDQDALNIVMQGKFLPLHPCWNVQIAMFKMIYSKKRRRKITHTIVEALKNPAIIHYTEAIKPWHYECFWPYVDEYYRYLDMTPWRGYRPRITTWDGILRKYRRKFKRRLKGMFLGYRI